MSAIAFMSPLFAAAPRARAASSGEEKVLPAPAALICMGIVSPSTAAATNGIGQGANNTERKWNGFIGQNACVVIAYPNRRFSPATTAAAPSPAITRGPASARLMGLRSAPIVVERAMGRGAGIGGTAICSR